MATSTNHYETEADRRPVTISAEDASRLLQEEGYTYLDVRTPEEYSNGHVAGAINVPYLLKEENGLVKNPKFLEDVSKKFSVDDKLVVACQGGRRSLLAATELVAQDFKDVKDLGGGLSAWIQSGLKTTSP